MRDFFNRHACLRQSAKIWAVTLSTWRNAARRRFLSFTPSLLLIGTVSVSAQAPSSQSSSQIAALQAQRGIEAIAQWSERDGSSDFAPPDLLFSRGIPFLSKAPRPRICNLITNPSVYTITRLAWGAPPQLSNSRANQAAVRLERGVVQYLRKSHWLPINGCYQREGALIYFHESSGRCTMNSPCAGPDELVLYVFSPNSDEPSRKRTAEQDGK